MKKFLFLLVSLCLICSLSACSKTPADSIPPADSSAADAPPDLVESDNPLLLSGFFTGDVLSGSGKNIGTYAYTKIEKNDLPDVFSSEFSAYLFEFAGAKVQDSGYNWVSIIFDDGTGVFFGGSGTLFADYGNLDNDGCITDLFGTFIKDSDCYEYEENPVRSIPDFTIKQEALVPENYFEPVPSEIFSTTAEENGLGDMAYYADGEIVSRLDVSGYDTIQVATPGGDLYISAAFIDLPDVSVGDPITVFFVYTGLSKSLNSPCGIYVYSE